MNITVNVEVTNETIKELLIGALEGGSNYWAIFRAEPDYVKSVTREDIETYNMEISQYYYPEYSIEHPNFRLQVRDVEDEGTHLVTLKDLEESIRIICKKYPNHLKSIIEEDWDAETSDALLQCAIFNEVIYG